jgi:type II restriction enzyme
LEAVIKRYKTDGESVYNTWFLNNDDRLKAFRSIRKSVQKVIAEIENGSFGNDFKGSSLETAVTAISEQKQIFEGAAHAFFWKPKLRIPDIYENESNKEAFGRFLKGCLDATNEDQILVEVHKLNELKIKGLGPAVANILYFLHPTLFPPFNTAIVNGFNTLFFQKKKLGSWEAYLEMREVILQENNLHRSTLSKDLGAIAGLLFEIGSNRLVVDENAVKVISSEQEKQTKANAKRHKEVTADQQEESAHTEMQYYLAKLGRSLGYKVWIARNDHKRVWNGEKLGEYSIKALTLPALQPAVFETVSLIDVLWLDEADTIVSGFEVEKSTSIYSGILRLNDLSLSIEGGNDHFYLVAPENREKEIQAQLLRPSFRTLDSLRISYILFKDLRCDCDAMCKFGRDVTVLHKICKSV